MGEIIPVGGLIDEDEHEHEETRGAAYPPPDPSCQASR
jgi:hypothetical protein